MANSIPTPISQAPQTFVYKTLGDLKIEADVYFPAKEHQKSPCPIFLNIHGGGWISGNRKEINMPMLHELLQRGIIVTSIDYRLLPESTFEEQLDDIRSAETWVRTDLPEAANGLGISTAPGKVLLGGGSAGGHLAMMVPHLWQNPPLAIFALYGPTDFTTLTPVEKTIKALAALPPLRPEVIKASLFDSPRTSTINIPQTDIFTSQRSLLGLELFRSGGIGEFVSGGLTSSFELRKPGSLPSTELEKISPALLPLHNYPPLFHVIGTEDQIFSVEQATVFAEKLNRAGVTSETMIVTGAQHAFDMGGGVGGEVHRNVIIPAVDFISQALDEAGKVSTRGIVSIDRPSDSFSRL